MRNWIDLLSEPSRQLVRTLPAMSFSISLPRSGGETGLIRAKVLASSITLMLPGARSHYEIDVEFARPPASLAAWQWNSLGVDRVCGPTGKIL